MTCPDCNATKILLADRDIKIFRQGQQIEQLKKTINEMQDIMNEMLNKPSERTNKN
jgi:hypothetical protein